MLHNKKNVLRDTARMAALVFVVTIASRYISAWADNVSAPPQEAQTVAQENAAEISKINMGERHLSDEEVKQRGKELRVALEQRYKEVLLHDTAIVYINTHRTIMDDVAIHYIPTGTSFEDAKEIMINAGMDCSMTFVDIGSSDDNFKLSPARFPGLKGDMVLEKNFIDQTFFSVTLFPNFATTSEARLERYRRIYNTQVYN